jgi:N-acetylglutamate synthase-like GNAT family acetyltransferase
MVMGRAMLVLTQWTVLDYLAVHPDNQRKGIATTLVKSGIEQAEKLELDIFVYAKQQGAKLYKALGFKVEWDTVLDDTMYGGIGNVYVALMVYEHKPKSAA